MERRSAVDHDSDLLGWWGEIGLGPLAGPIRGLQAIHPCNIL
jgi:hypothetical protein